MRVVIGRNMNGQAYAEAGAIEKELNDMLTNIFTPRSLDKTSMKKMSFGFKSALIGASLILLSACATTTPYQEASKPGAFDGYTETIIENDRARVSFGGNSTTDRETVENYLLYRAAELAVERGFEHFTLVESDTESKTRLRSTGGAGFGFNDPFFRYSYFRPGFGWSRFGRFSSFGGSGFRGRGFGRSGFGRRGFGGFRGGFRGGFGHGFGGGLDVREITKYRAIAEVKFSRGVKPEGDRTFDAREVLTNLGPIIVYPDAAQDQVVAPEVTSNEI